MESVKYATQKTPFFLIAALLLTPVSISHLVIFSPIRLRPCVIHQSNKLWHETRKKFFIYIKNPCKSLFIQAHCISASVATEEQKQSCTKRAGKNLFESHHFFVCSPSSLWHFLSLSRETYSLNSLCWMDFHIFLPY